MRFILGLCMAFHVGIYRLLRGRWMGSIVGIRVLLLTTTGRGSGMPHTVPLGGFDYKDVIVIVD